MAKSWLIERGPLLISFATFTAELNIWIGLVSYGKQYRSLTCIFIAMSYLPFVCFVNWRHVITIYITHTQNPSFYYSVFIIKLCYSLTWSNHLHVYCLIYLISKIMCFFPFECFSACIYQPTNFSVLSLTRFANSCIQAFLIWLWSNIVNLNQARNSP